MSNFWRGVFGAFALMGMRDVGIDDPREEEPLLLVDQDVDDELRCMWCGCEISECPCLRAGKEE
ncbi:MAG: hypothetical protein WBN92_16870 [Terriglobia bacterium]